MTNEEKPLPKPPTTPFGRRKREESDAGTPLMADRIAAAMAEGRIEEFLKNEVPDNDQARALVTMMMGMTGMMPAGGFPMPATPPGEQTAAPADPGAEHASTAVPEEVIKAVQGADVEALKEMLRKEHQKRTQGNAAEPPRTEPQQGPSLTAGEKEVMDSLIKIAADNRVTVDWLILRALRIYVEDFRKTGRL